MKRSVTLAGVALACLALCACSSTSTGQLLNNLQGCERHYDGAVAGSLTGGSFSGTIKVDCKSGQGIIATGAVASTPAPTPAASTTPPPGGT